MKKIKNKNDKPKLNFTLIICAVIFVVILFLSWFTIRLFNSTKDRIQSNMEVELARLERNFSDRMEHTYLIIKNINSRILENPSNKNHINEILKIYRTDQSLVESFSWTIFSWLNSDYQIIVNSKDGILTQPIDLSVRTYVQMTEKEPQTFQLGTPIIGFSSKKWLIPGGVGLTDQNGKYLGATTIGFEIESMANLLHKVIKNPNVKFGLFGKNEVPILFGDINSFGIDRSNDDALHDVEMGKILNTINSGKSEKIFDISFFENRHAFLAKKVADYPYILFFKYNKKAIIKELVNTAVSRLVEILSTIFSLTILLILIYRERQQSHKILQLKQATRSANSAKTEFLFKAAHEFKNFIFGIQGCAEIIKNDLKELTTNLKKEEKSINKTRLHSLEIDLDLSHNIIEASQDLDNFINDLLTLNRAEIGAFKINRSVKPVDIAKIIRQAKILSKKRAKSSDIILVNRIDENLHHLPNLDPLLLKQMVMRLIANAIKYSQSGSVIEIIANNVSDEQTLDKVRNLTGINKAKAVQITIKDQGFGMSEHEIKLAMQKYKNIKKAKDIDPFGLSLPVIKYLVEKQGGIMEVRSQKNQGSEITIIF